MKVSTFDLPLSSLPPKVRSTDQHIISHYHSTAAATVLYFLYLSWMRRTYKHPSWYSSHTHKHTHTGLLFFSISRHLHPRSSYSSSNSSFSLCYHHRFNIWIHFILIFSITQHSHYLLGCLKRDDCFLLGWGFTHCSWLLRLTWDLKKEEHGVQAFFRLIHFWLQCNGRHGTFSLNQIKDSNQRKK